MSRRALYKNIEHTFLEKEVFYYMICIYYIFKQTGPQHYFETENITLKIGVVNKFQEVMSHPPPPNE